MEEIGNNWTKDKVINSGKSLQVEVNKKGFFEGTLQEVICKNST
jgi:hypothetical protein